MESKQEVRCERSGVEEGSVDTSHLKKKLFPFRSGRACQPAS